MRLRRSSSLAPKMPAASGSTSSWVRSADSSATSLFRQKLLASVSRRPHERRERVRRPDALKIRMAVRRARCRPCAGRRLGRLRTQGYRRHNHTDDEEHAFHVMVLPTRRVCLFRQGCYSTLGLDSDGPLPDPRLGSHRRRLQRPKAAAMRDVVWRALAAVGIHRDDPTTWRKERPDHLQHLKSDPVFRAVRATARRRRSTRSSAGSGGDSHRTGARSSWCSRRGGHTSPASSTHRIVLRYGRA